MLRKLSDYEKFIGKEEIENIKNSSAGLIDKSVAHVNATAFGGGVAEMLNTLVILMNDLGIYTDWDVIKGGQSFFNITKSFHNGLQGQEINLSDQKKRIYLEETERNSLMTHFNMHDLVVIHDPQPVAMIDYSKKKQPWVWRCHIDITKPFPVLWDFISKYVKKYDGAIFSMDKYKKDLGIPEFIIPPSIDPLSMKNMPLNGGRVERILTKGGIDVDRPIISQISRFDKWKDPLGVVKIFEKVREKHDCQLVMVGNMASDDPEGPKIYKKFNKKVNGNPDIITKIDKGDIFVNAVQRASSVIIQNSIREGFALTVTEALWKETPVVAKAVGGIPLQVIDGKTGFLIDDIEGGAKRVLELLKNKKIGEEMGRNAKEHVKKNFLITRHLQDYIDLFNRYIGSSNSNNSV
jgi:trehalose synthase